MCEFVGVKVESRITNYEFQFFWFFLTDVDIILPKEFCLSGRVVGNGVIVRRSATYGYGGYCLSGKGGEKLEIRKMEVRNE